MMRVSVIGGGTAGWITALYLQRFFTRAEITVVESSTLGILGAGEGTTPHFVGDFLDVVGITVGELVKHAGAVAKNGIRFLDWTSEGSAYYHPFDDISVDPMSLRLLHPDHRADEHELVFAGAASELGRVVIGPGDADADSTKGPYSRSKCHGAMALHFDAVRLASYLKSVAVGRGVQLIDGIVEDFDQDEHGNILRVRLDDGRTVDNDLIFDCTGFHRVILGKLFKSEWRDLRHVLPVDRAIPFSLPLGDGPIPPYTDAIALKHGWMWRIPVEGRFGCGYVFDSNCIDGKGALEELKTKFGPNVDATKVLSFTSGYYERIWINNCLGVGLSTGFLEPLEATSIWGSIITLREFLRVYLPLNDSRARSEFQQFYQTFMQRTVDFLYLHYLTPRTDTPFWATFRQRTQMPEAVAALLANGGLRWRFAPSAKDGGHPLPFPPLSWTYIARGLGLMHRNALKQHWDYFDLEDGWQDRRDGHVRRIQDLVQACWTHEEFLAAMRVD